MLDDGAVALDVRPGDEFAAAHVPGSVSIPLVGTVCVVGGSGAGTAARGRC